MEILVTGCAGFIGSHLSEKILREGHILVGIDNLERDNNFHFKKENLKRLSEFNNFHFFKNNIMNHEKINSIFSNYHFDKIVHLAAKTGVRQSITNPIEYYNSNINGTLVLLDLCTKYGITDFVFASSSSVYGNLAVPFEENMTCNPISPYGLSKQTGELYGKNFSDIFGINFIALRFFTVYGPRQRIGMAISNFVKGIINKEEIQVFGDGTFVRDYTYVDDIVEGIILALERKFSYEIFNIGSGEAISLRNLINLIENETMIQAKIKYEKNQQGDVEITHANITKASKLLGYRPKTNLINGIKKYINWLKRTQ